MARAVIITCFLALILIGRSHCDEAQEWEPVSAGAVSIPRDIVYAF